MLFDSGACIKTGNLVVALTHIPVIGITCFACNFFSTAAIVMAETIV